MINILPCETAENYNTKVKYKIIIAGKLAILF